MSLGRDLTTVGAATLLSRLLGFVRDMGIAALLGAGVLSDAYFAALQIPNLFRRLLAEGAVNSAFVPMWMRLREQDGAAATQRLGESAIGALVTALGGFAVMSFVFAPAVVHLIAPGFAPSGERHLLAVDYLRLSIPYLLFVGVVAIAAAVLNAQARVGAAAFGIVAFNAVLLVGVGLVFLIGANATPLAGSILSAAVAFAGFAQLLLVGGAMLRLKEAPRYPRFGASPQLRRFLIQAFPGVIAAGIPQLKFVSAAIIVSSSQAAVSWLYYANRLYELPLGVASVAIASVMVPRISASRRANGDEDFSALQSRGLEIACAVAFPAAIAFAILADLIVGGLFERGAFGPRDTAAVAGALIAICAGLPGHVLEKSFAAVAYAHEDTRTPMLAALCGLGAAIVGGLFLFPRHGHVGVAPAIAASGWVGAVILGIILHRRRWLQLDAPGRRRLPLIVVAAIVMGVIVSFAQAALPAAASAGVSRIVGLAALVALGLGTYLALLQILGIARISELWAATRRRL